MGHPCLNGPWPHRGFPPPEHLGGTKKRKESLWACTEEIPLTGPSLQPAHTAFCARASPVFLERSLESVGFCDPLGKVPIKTFQGPKLAPAFGSGRISSCRHWGSASLFVKANRSRCHSEKALEASRLLEQALLLSSRGQGAEMRMGRPHQW